MLSFYIPKVIQTEDFHPQILDKNMCVSFYPTLFKHIKLIAEFSISKAEEPSYGHDANELGTKHVKTKDVISSSSEFLHHFTFQRLLAIFPQNSNWCYRQVDSLYEYTSTVCALAFFYVKSCLEGQNLVIWSEINKCYLKAFKNIALHKICIFPEKKKKNSKCSW